MKIELFRACFDVLESFTTHFQQRADDFVPSLCDLPGCIRNFLNIGLRFCGLRRRYGFQIGNFRLFYTIGLAIDHHDQI
uniref:Uncharacterized protein n=1 Tax=mine drainage metagenome TaxID=410659 RepID=E6QNS7_9ZZZZ